MLAVAQKQYLVGHGGLHGYEHRVDVVIYSVAEMHVTLAFAYEHLAYAETAVGYALDFAHDAKHRRDPVLALVGEAALRASVEIVGDLYLHAVGNLLILLQARELFGKLVRVGLDVHDVLRHAYHALHALGVDHDLLLGLGDVELRRADHTGRYKLELKLLAVGRGDRHKPLDYLDIQSGEPYHYGEVDEIEHGVKHRQAYRHALLHGRYLSRHRVAGGQRVVKQVVVGGRVGGLDIVDKCREGPRVALAQLLGEPLGEVAERKEDGQRPGRAQKVKQQMAHGGSLGCHISAH